MKNSIRKPRLILMLALCVLPFSALSFSLNDVTDAAKKLGNEVWDETRQVFKHPKKQFKKGANFVKQTTYQVVKESDKFFSKTVESTRKRLGDIGVHIKADDKVWLYGSALINPNTGPKIAITLVDDDFSVYEQEVQQRADSYVFDFKNLLVNPVYVQVDETFKKQVAADQKFSYRHDGNQAVIKVFIQRRPGYCGYDEDDPAQASKQCWEPWFDQTVSLPKAAALQLNRYSEIEFLFSE